MRGNEYVALRLLLLLRGLHGCHEPLLPVLSRGDGLRIVRSSRSVSCGLFSNVS